ncbi:MAG: hypothetical protein HRT87_12285 [Legionellales bacterium]|nr:hypothetical protein [Legionellales bacterium]
MKKIKINYYSLMEKDTPDEYEAISTIELDFISDAVAFIDALPKDRVITKISDITNLEEISTIYADESVYG